MVSEVMLQQTQVSRVIPAYHRFLKKYPTIESLSRAGKGEVIRLWRGLGYNKRALYLHNIAEIIMRDFHGIIPKDEHLLMKLPGLGKYTARAILIFAYHTDIAAVDTNIRRVITHFFYNDIHQPEKEILETAAKLVPAGRSWDWHQALMDYAAIALPRTKPSRKNNPRPFKTTDRFFRGRIIEVLRRGDTSISQLTHSFMKLYGKDSGELSEIVEKLVSEGLVERKGNTLFLPE